MQKTPPKQPVIYEQLLPYLFNLKKERGKYELDNIRQVLIKAGNPQNNFKSVHITGTNGKGSVARMITSILQEAGYKVGTLTSPHLNSFRERITINNKFITKKEVITHFKKVHPHIREVEKKRKIRISFFETLTAIAFSYFAKKNVDFAVLEVGLGGRLDATNVINAEVSCITNIGLDHTKILGRTRKKIAKEKIEIIKDNNTLVTTEEDKKILQLFKEHCKKKKATYINAQQTLKTLSQTITKDNTKLIIKNKKTNTTYNLQLQLLGEYQINNAKAAIILAEQLQKKYKNITKKTIEQGLNKTTWAGRLEKTNNHPLTILDGAHNLAGIKTLVKFVKTIKENERRTTHTTSATGKITSRSTPTTSRTATPWRNLEGRDLQTAGAANYMSPKRCLHQQRVSAKPFEKSTLVLGIASNKNHKPIIKTITPLFDNIIFTKAQHRGTDPKLLARIYKKIQKEKINKTKKVKKNFIITNTVKEAIALAKKQTQKNDLLIVAGSLFLVAEARPLLIKNKRIIQDKLLLQEAMPKK